jgi:hypothetical protein
VMELEGGEGAGLEFVSAVVCFFELVAVFGEDGAEVSIRTGGVTEALVAAAFFVTEEEGIFFGLGVLGGEDVVDGVVAFVVAVLIPGFAGVIGIGGVMGAGFLTGAVEGGGASIIDADEVRGIGSFMDSVFWVGEGIIPSHVGAVAADIGETGEGKRERGERAEEAVRVHGVEEWFVCFVFM